MTFNGHIENGLVVFDAAPGLPDGTPVVVSVIEKTVVEKAVTQKTAANETVVEKTEPAADDIPTLYEQLKPFIGKIEGLPEDASENIDHYIYGHSKK